MNHLVKPTRDEEEQGEQEEEEEKKTLNKYLAQKTEKYFTFR